ncbi:hypothetical protein DIPPA_17801 [Diplonema papillatum]|nr:hypothetical protein DIPPA_17801 [Diplonema papillatum]
MSDEEKEEKPTEEEKEEEKAKADVKKAATGPPARNPDDITLKEVNPDGDMKQFAQASGKCFLAIAVDKINRHFKKDRRVMTLGEKDGQYHLYVFPPGGAKDTKRAVPFKDIESVVAARVEDTTGLIKKVKVTVTQMLVRMMPSCGEKDFLLNLRPDECDADSVLEIMKDIFEKERSMVLPITDLRSETGAPTDLRDWLNQAGLKK